MPHSDSHCDLRPFLAELCTVSGDVARHYYRQPFDVISKADASPVTIADRTIEERLREMIEKRFPTDGIIGEEYGTKAGTSGRTWVLDPIDGTKSFTIGRPTFTTLIGVCDDGKPVVGVIDQPITHDRWVGVVGQGAWWNDTPIKTRACAEGVKPVCGVGSGDQIGDANYQRIKEASRYMIYQGDAFLYGLVAMGNMDAVIEATLGVYDIMALVPVVVAAGGVLTDWEGREITIEADHKVVAAGDKTLHARILWMLDKEAV